ncbi:MAG: alpha/beta fold hydrolase [Rhodospirillales bacterium]|nr:alpha/beta fold hydrolase [Rhodospirillales bacterium]MCW8861178.1 alpha/beta fold hydrolase [Rhodospirillales bacterium]MCW8951159.1 alpha/beta fold hydrolase [Rhodospirillales bacterium]MCW8970961.1 alpha/beta fold hydrolase [Rhodospirillales bacterium]MCW9002649.1 alpha/beta fold hydrolase [Rhodospirillales bacterium]
MKKKSDEQAPDNPTAGQQKRLGPRPLLMHMGIMAGTWMSSRAALPYLKNGSLPWNPDLEAAGKELESALANVNPETFASAIDAAVAARADAFVNGVRAYQAHSAHRTMDEPPVLWCEGTTRVLDYGQGGDGPPLLIVPSLINRAYVLDISEERSMVRFLAGKGFRPYLVDWGAPGDVEREFSLDDYIMGRLNGALDAVRTATGEQPVDLLGYCMGGLLTLALAQRRAGAIRTLALLATPWDFHAASEDVVALYRSLSTQSRLVVDACGELPVDVIQGIFAALDPYRIQRKFAGFAGLDPESAAAREFVTLEDWLNDGVPLVGKVARECLEGWYAENRPAKGEWRIGGKAVEPARIDMPTLLMVPEADYIVPPECARALASVIPNSDCRTIPAGHIGMVAGSKARRVLHEPLACWLSDTMC